MAEDFRDERGRLRPGHPGLKPRGASNRLQAEIKHKITDFLNGELDSLQDIYSQVSPKDKLRFLAELLAYILPKSKEISIGPQSEQVDLSALSESDLETLTKIHQKIA